MAISYDTGVNATIANPGSSLTWSHTCTGSERILFVSATINRSSITGITYGGVSMTAIGSPTLGGDGFYNYLYYLVAPATGANNVVITPGSSVLILGSSVSYTGAAQTGQPDGSNSQTGTNSSMTTSITTTADNCWAVLHVRACDLGVSSAGTGSTQRTNTNGYIQIYDSNGPKTPAGSLSMTVTQTSQPVVHKMATFAPYVATTSHIKSWNGIANS